LATPRVYLTGRLAIEHGSKLVDEREFPGRQGRLAFAFLATERRRPISRDELSSVVWPDKPPLEADAAMSAILSKLRAAFKKAGLPEKGSVEVHGGAIHMRLPSDAWVDIEHAANATEDAEGALRAGDLRRAWGDAVTATIIARRPFLAGEDAPWIESRRAKLRALLVRGLHCLSQTSVANDEPALAVQYATEMIEVEPFREAGYRHLMRLHAHMGNRAEALRVLGKCRELLRDELGADPSRETEAAFLEILRAGQ
jgi:SARP family transcriptional regulator, regulator of embCAB operon